MTGRPSSFDEKIADAICERLAEGQSLRSICKSDDMPSVSTVCRWLADPERSIFREQYAQAREAQADALADEILDIADDGLNDTYVDGEGNEKIDHDVIARSKLRVDARKWIAAKLKPRKYGEKQLVGSDPENPLPSGFQVTLVKGADA